MGMGARRLATGIAAAAAAWLVAANGVAAQFVSTGNPAGAAALAPDADRLSRHAQQLFFEKRYAQASALARRSLAISPLQVRAARVLGQAELALGHDDAGFPAMNFAALGGWRDNVTQLWTLQAALASGDHDAALQRADALIRRRAMTDQLYAMLRPQLGEADFRAALVARLADRPDWRGELFLDWRHAAPGELPGIVQLVADLDHSPLPVTDLERFPLVERLIELGAIPAAQALWRARAPRAGWSPGNLVYDARFAVARSRQYGEMPPRFEWWIDPDRTSLASIESAPDGRGAALRIGSNGGDPAIFARQALVLVPGTYRLLARIHARSTRDFNGLDFALRCGPRDRDLELHDRQIVTQSRDLLRYSSVAAVPAECTRVDVIVKSSGAPLGGTIAIGEIALVRLQ